MNNFIKFDDCIDPISIANNVLKLQEDVEKTEANIQNMYRQLSTNKPLENALQKYKRTLKIGSFDTKFKLRYLGEPMNIEDVVNLINDVETVDSYKMALIAKIIEESNKNTQKAAQLIGGLSMLTGLNYQNVRDIAKISAKMDEELGRNSLSISETSRQLRDFIKLQFKRISDEKEYHDKLNIRLNNLESELGRLNKNCSSQTTLNNDNKIENSNNTGRYSSNFMNLTIIFSLLSLAISFITMIFIYMK